MESHFNETDSVLEFILNGNYPTNTIGLNEDKAQEIVKTLEGFNRSEQDLLAHIRKNQSTNQVTATVLPVKSVGVQGDGRTYNYVCALICKNPDWEQLIHLAKIITKASTKYTQNTKDRTHIPSYVAVPQHQPCRVFVRARGTQTSVEHCAHALDHRCHFHSTRGRWHRQYGKTTFDFLRRRVD